MILNFERSYDKMSCSQQVLYSALTLLRPEMDCFPLTYIDAWGFHFDFDDHEKTIGERMVSSGKQGYFDFNILDVERKYFRFHPESEEEFEALKAFIAEQIKLRRPVILWADAFDLPWNRRYGERHSGNHALLVVGFEEGSDEIYCSEIQESPYIEKVSLRKIRCGLEGCTCITNVASVGDLGEARCAELFRSHLEQLFESGMFDDLHRFADYLGERLDLSRECEGHWLITVPFFVRVLDLSKNLALYARALDYFKIKFGRYELDSAINDLEKLSADWDILKNVFLKYAVGKPDALVRETVSERVHKIADGERAVAEELRAYFADSQATVRGFFASPAQTQWEEEQAFSDFRQLDLAPYLNNRAFASSLENRENADLSGVRQFLILKKTLPEHKLVYGSLHFDVHIDGDGTFDNVVCDRQVIPVAAQVPYRYLFFVACAEFMHQESEVFVTYEDGSEERIDLNVSDWRSEARFGEQVIYPAHAADIVNANKSVFSGNAYVFLQRLTLDSNKCVREIRLPYHPTINIFAMGLSN